MTEAYVEDVSFRTMREGDILEEAGASFDDANEPERRTSVLDMGCSLDSLGLLGGREAIQAWVAQLNALLDDDDRWT